jgi:hypothetical protein
MKAVKVQYMVKPDYVETNKGNIERVMADLRELNNPGIKYSSFQLGDGRTFVHFGMYADEAAQAVVGNLATFQHFRQQLQASEPEMPPQADDLSLVASAYDIF